MATIPSTSPERLYTFQPRFPDVRAMYDADNERQFRRAIADAFTQLASKPAQARPYLYAIDYGVVGDGVTDDTAAMQAALSDGATQHKIVYAGALVVKITSGLTMSGPGLVFDHCAYGSAGDPGILVAGTGYTGLTIASGTQLSALCVAVYGTGQAANGIYFNNPILCKVQAIRAYNFAGFGVKIDRCFDCLFHTISVELCGTSSDYAFSMNPAGDTCNMTHVLRLQVEQATQKAIYVDVTTLSCVFHNIHSERATAAGGVNTWVLSGHACLYGAVRLNATGATHGTAYLQSVDSCYVDLLTESSVDVTLEGAALPNPSTLTLVHPDIGGTVGASATNPGPIQILGGNITAMATQPSIFRVYGTKIGTLTIDFANSDPTLSVFEGCTITTLASSSTLSAATFSNCTIGEGNNLLRGKTVLLNTTVTCANPIAHSSGMLDASHSTINAALTYTNNAPIRLRNGSRITGTVSCGDAGNVDFLCDDSSTVGSASTGVGIPTGGAHNVGDRHKNPIPVVGNPKAWSCTVAGTPGTWVSEGNL